jgi:hypothetical protein
VFYISVQYQHIKCTPDIQSVLTNAPQMPSSCAQPPDLESLKINFKYFLFYVKFKLFQTKCRNFQLCQIANRYKENFILKIYCKLILSILLKLFSKKNSNNYLLEINLKLLVCQNKAKMSEHFFN